MAQRVVTEEDIEGIVKYYSSDEFIRETLFPKKAPLIHGFFRDSVSHSEGHVGASIYSLVNETNPILDMTTIEDVIDYLKNLDGLNTAERVLLYLHEIGDRDNVIKIWLYLKSKKHTRVTADSTIEPTTSSSASSAPTAAPKKSSTKSSKAVKKTPTAAKKPPTNPSSSKGGGSRKYKRRSSRKNKSYKVRRT